MSTRWTSSSHWLRDNEPELCKPCLLLGWYLGKPPRRFPRPARPNRSFNHMPGHVDGQYQGEAQHIHFSGAFVVEHRSQRADNLNKFSLRLEDRTNVLVRSRSLVPELPVSR